MIRAEISRYPCVFAFADQMSFYLLSWAQARLNTNLLRRNLVNERDDEICVLLDEGRALHWNWVGKFRAHAWRIDVNLQNIPLWIHFINENHEQVEALSASSSNSESDSNDVIPADASEEIWWKNFFATKKIVTMTFHLQI